MGYNPFRILAIVAAALAFGASAAAAAEGESERPKAEPPPDFLPADAWLNLHVHLYGFSYHTDRQGVRRDGLDNELNLGFGLNYTFHQDEHGVGFAEAGIYRDSGSNQAKLAGLGYQYKYGKRWRLGGALVAVQSETYNRGGAFVAPLPIVTYDLGAVKLNVIYVPKYGDYNRFAVWGLYFTLPLAK